MRATHTHTHTEADEDAAAAVEDVALRCLFCFNFLDFFFPPAFFFAFLPTFFSAIPLGFFFRYLKNSSVLNCCHVFIVVEFGLVCAWRAKL